MSKPPPAPPSLEVLRKEIDSIDEQVHRLLMARGDIIDRLIQVKQTQEVGSAFRPAREADMMRRLVERHRGILPIDTVESIWRVIISTFTYVQAPFSVHADLSAGDARDHEHGQRRRMIGAFEERHPRDDLWRAIGLERDPPRRAAGGGRDDKRAVDTESFNSQ